MLLQQPDKVGVFAHDDDVCTAGRGEDFRIRRTLKAQITNRQALNGDRRAEGIPADHAADVPLLLLVGKDTKGP